MCSKPNLVSLCGIADDATEADLSGLNMDADDAIVLASELPDKGALSSVNLLFNGIGTEKAQALVIILKEHPALKSLCGNKGNETELDMSGKPGKRMGAEGAIMRAPAIIDNGALSKICLASNDLRAGGAKIIAAALTSNSTLLKLDVSNNDLGMSNRYFSNGLGSSSSDTSGVIALANVIEDNEAMTSLNLASNDICSYGNTDGIKAISSAVKVLAIILVPFSFLSDLSFNCWCLLLSTEYAGTINAGLWWRWLQRRRCLRSARYLRSWHD
jgi:hypothetical protein